MNFTKLTSQIILVFNLLGITAYINNVLAKELIVGVEAVSYYPLYDFSTNDISKPSFTKELLTGFFESHHYPYKLLLLPIKRFDKWFVEENIDFKFPDNVRWRSDNSLNITFSAPVLLLEAGAYVLKKNKNIQRHEVKKLGTILGFYPTLWQEEVKNNQVSLLEETNPIAVVKHLLHGNIQATNIDANVIRHNLSLLGKNEAVVLSPHIHSELFYYHLSSIKYPQIIAEFNQYLKDNKQNLDELKRKYQLLNKP